jgi:hypothetical protein
MEQTTELDSQLEAAKADQLRFEGGKQAMIKATQEVRALAAFAAKQHEEGELSEEDLDKAMVWIGRFHGVVEGLGKHMENSSLIAGGKVTGLGGALAHLIRRVDGERAAMQAKEENGGVSPTLAAARAENPAKKKTRKKAPHKKKASRKK